MKKYSYILLALMAVVLTGCEDFLSEPVYTQPTGDYLVESEEGLASTVVAMYYQDRSIFRNGDDTDGETYYVTLIGDDITYVRAGGGTPQFGRYSDLISSNPDAKRYWKYQYQMIGYANLVINAGEKLPETDNLNVTLGEAHCFRAHAYLRLLQRFDNIYITTTAVTPETLNDDVHYAPAPADSVYQLIQSDLAVAIKSLPLTTTDNGRFTRGAARHILARAAAYMNDWQVVADQVDSIEASNVYHLCSTPREVFASADLNHEEAILVSQWDRSTGGWFVNTNVDPITYNGHRMSIVFVPRYNYEQGMKLDLAQGGYAWGRIFPNQHLLDMYDKEHDLRYEQYYRHYWTYNNADGLGRGQHLGDTIFAVNQAQYQNVHPAITKYEDTYTVSEPSETSSFKDIIIYRLAETYLLGCEANIHLGNQGKAREYFNKTYTRAGNPEWTGEVTIEDFLNEHARELAMEGDRWCCLKREGKLGEYVRRYGGEYLVNEKGQLLMNDTVIRTNFKDYMVRWPIPLTQIELMSADGYPQNEGY